MDASFLLLPDAPAFARARPGALAAQPFSPHCSDEQPAMHVRRYGARQRVFSVGDPARSIFEVAQGAVLISRYLGDGRRQIVDMVGPGRLFGFAADRHQCTAEASTASMVCSLDRQAAEASPVVLRRMQAAMLGEIEHLRDMAILLGRKTAVERVATLLMALAGNMAGAPTTIAMPVTRAEMADYLGLTTETVSRTLTRLKQRGHIAIHEADAIALSDPAALQQLASGADAAGG